MLLLSDYGALVMVLMPDRGLSAFPVSDVWEVGRTFCAVYA